MVLMGGAALGLVFLCAAVGVLGAMCLAPGAGLDASARLHLGGLVQQQGGDAEMRLWAVKSTALAAQNLMLALQSHGFASCPMEGFDEVRLRKVLQIPRRAVPIMLLAAGRAADNGVYNPRLRFPLEQRVSWH